MVWGKPQYMCKHPEGEEHIQLWDLPRLMAMVTRVKAKLEAILGKTLHVMTQGYIKSITHVRQLPDRAFPAASLPVDGIALSVFWALLMDVLDDDVCAQFAAMSTRAFPRPWIIHRMRMKRGSLWVMSSTLVHEGGGLPLGAELGSRRIIEFLWAVDAHCVLHHHPRHHAPVLGAQGRCELWSPPMPREADK